MDSYKNINVIINMNIFYININNHFLGLDGILQPV